jgi:AraC-like DNA-binding protein
MERPPSRIVAHAIDAAAPLRLTMCGIRAPREPFSQVRRVMPDFIAFLVIKGEIRLADEMPDVVEPAVVRAGDIHVAAPGTWQASIGPFPAGIVFLWFHFSCDGPAEALTAEATDAVVRRQLHPEADALAQARWLVPRHLHLGDELDDFTRAHTELLENARLWGIADRGTQTIGAALVYRLHRALVRSRQRVRSFIRTAPDAAHVGRAKAFIRLHHERPIALAEVAAGIGLNPEYLSRCFRRVTGQTVGEALLAARIETAKRLLLDGHNVKAAAFHAGFGSASYFCRQFRRVAKATPLGYVAAARRAPEAAGAAPRRTRASPRVRPPPPATS